MIFKDLADTRQSEFKTKIMIARVGNQYLQQPAT